MIQYTHDLACMNVVYDYNGLKGPNKVGKDIGFVSVINNDSQAEAVSPFVYKEDSSTGTDNHNAAAICRNLENANGKSNNHA